MTIINPLEIVEHRKCRLCKSKDITDSFSIGNQFINDFVEKKNIGQGRKAPLDLFICNNCSLIQLRYTAPQELLYTGHYWYKSGVTETMKNALKEISSIGENSLGLSDKDIVLDIGANDGTFLDTFSNKNLTLIGCEPAKNLISELNSVTKYSMHDFWSYESFQENLRKWGINPDAKVKFITALGMFYDMEDPNKFVKDVSLALDENGVFIAQLMCLASMLKSNDVGNICHEHIEYYSLKSLKYLFEKNGLEIFKIEENNVNGGSYRIFSRKFKNGSIDFDEDYGIDDLNLFYERIEQNKKLCTEFIKSEVSNGKTVYVYGASTKGNAILQYYDLDCDVIKAASDRSPEKVGRYTVGSWIPIVSEEEAREKNPDYFFVLPWGFFSEMYERESEWRSKGGKFILCTPEFKVVS